MKGSQVSLDIERQQGMLKAKQAELKEAQESLELVGVITDTALQLFEGKYPRQQVQPTIAADGSPRLTGFTMDEDAYSGHFDKQAIHGTTLVDGRQLFVEEFYPSGKSRNTYITHVDLSTGEVSAHSEPNDGSGLVPLEGTTRLEGGAKVKELKQVMFRLQSYGSMDSMELERGLGLINLQTPYEFRVEQLR